MLSEKIEVIKEKLKLRRMIVSFKNHTAKRYKIGLELIRNKTLEESDLELLSTYEPSIVTVINFIKDKQTKEQLKEANKAILERQTPLIEEQIQQVSKELALIEEEQLKASSIECFTFEQIQEKRNKIDAITKKLELTQKHLSDFVKVKESLFPAKKPGRPKKEVEQTMQQKLLDKAAETKQINKLQSLEVEENIIIAIKTLSAEQKEYVYNNILKMLEVDKELKGVVNV